MNWRWLLFTSSALSLCACAMTPTLEPQTELEAMFESDQRHRAAMMEAFQKHGPDAPEVFSLWEKQHAIDQENLKRLESIVADGGWPKLSVVGDKAASAAFLIVQHANLATQEKYLPILRQAVTAGEARASDLALLEDRVLMEKGKKQQYGSQLQSDGKGGWEFYPIEDEANVDERRRSVGLPPLADYAREFGFEYHAIKAQPAALQNADSEEVLIGTISRFECGDNCYLQITLGTGMSVTYICHEPELCSRWVSEWEPEYLGKTVRCTVGKGSAYAPNVILGDDGSFLRLEEFGEVDMFTSVEVID